LLGTTEIASSNTYLLIDLQCLHGKDVELLATQVSKFLNALSASEWAGILIGGYGIPDQVSSVVSSNDQGYLPRVELDVHAEVVAHTGNNTLWLADYATLPPSVVELDWKLIHKVMCPKAIYALSDSWFVVRGGAFSSHPDGHDQYYSLAEEIVALPEFCGPDYSYGDAYICDRANRIATPGSPASWITACVNHHITLTAAAFGEPS
jgi:hypothetical protein